MGAPVKKICWRMYAPLPTVFTYWVRALCRWIMSRPFRTDGLRKSPILCHASFSLGVIADIRHRCQPTLTPLSPAHQHARATPFHRHCSENKDKCATNSPHLHAHVQPARIIVPHSPARRRLSTQHAHHTHHQASPSSPVHLPCSHHAGAAAPPSPALIIHGPSTWSPFRLTDTSTTAATSTTSTTYLSPLCGTCLILARSMTHVDKFQLYMIF